MITNKEKSRQMAQPPVGDALLAAREANIALIQAKKPDKSYTSEYRRFCKFVDAQDELHTTEEGLYITRANIDHYFTRVISRRKGIRNVVRRALSGIRWYAKNREYIMANPPFDVDSVDVEAAFAAQKVFMSLAVGGTSTGSDPHKGLKDIFPVSDKLLFMRHLYRLRPDWGPGGINFNWGQNAAVRGHSILQLLLCNLNISFGFGPEDFGPHARALLIVLQKGNIHKDRHETDDQVCCWRHKFYELCSVFSTALYVIFCVTKNPTLNFLHPERLQGAPWWGIPLIEWASYSEASNSTQEVLDATGISSTKLTHHRTAALQYGGFEGLRPDQINTMTHHMIDKQHSAYQSVTEREVSKKLYSQLPSRLGLCTYHSSRSSCC